MARTGDGAILPQYDLGAAPVQAALRINLARREVVPPQPALSKCTAQAIIVVMPSAFLSANFAKYRFHTSL
jgi:hypothetical protein